MFLFLLRKGDLRDEPENKPDAAFAAADAATDAADVAVADAVAASAAAPIFDISLQTMSVLLHHQRQLFLISVEKKRKFVLLPNQFNKRYLVKRIHIVYCTSKVSD